MQITPTLLSGNEAIALGAVEAGVLVASAYPGTPSTEVLQALSSYPEVDSRWAPNEKVALDVALGASLGGARAMAVMKHVGLNVAADTLMTSAYTGVGAGLVIVVADDPGMFSSQNEQDTRFYARFAGLPIMEPASSDEARRFVSWALDISEQFDTPVILRSTTRVSHNRGVVTPGERTQHPATGFARDATKYVMVPGNARRRRPLLLDRMERLAEFIEDSPLTVETGTDSSVGILTAGIAYHYVREVLPDVRVLRLGISYPMPMRRIREFAASVDRLLVVEELEPLMEQALLAAGIPCEGKAFFNQVGELGPDMVRDGFARAGLVEPRVVPAPPPPTVNRPPVLCAGCPHTAPFVALRRLGAVVSGDIGCYTLAALEPLSAMDTCVAMGSSIGMAAGMSASGGIAEPVVATIGDSTFLHGGIPGLMDAVYNKSNITVVILDNGTTAMTGGQDHPGTGFTLKHEEASPVDLVGLCRALGVEDVSVVDPYDIAATEKVLQDAMAHVGPSVVITNRPCVQAPVKIWDWPFVVDAASCTACQLCMNLGCPAISWTDDFFEGRRKVTIEAAACTGCTLCAQVCAPHAITLVEEWRGKTRV